MAIRAVEPPGDLMGYADEPCDAVITPMRRRHLRAVMRIEVQAYPRPWSTGLFLSELALKPSRDYFVAKVDGIVVGYAGMMTHAGEAHVTNIAVDLSWRRRQIATRLMIQLMHTAMGRGVQGVTLEVRAGNRSAQSLYHHFGFVPSGIRKNYYPESGEDAVIMWVHEVRTDAYAQRLEAIAGRIRGKTAWA